MKRSMAWFSCIILLLCSISGAFAAETQASGSQEPPTSPSNQAKAASIQISEKTFDFGEIMEGGDVSHDFVVKNTGAEVLQIEQVRGG